MQNHLSLTDEFEFFNMIVISVKLNIPCIQLSERIITKDAGEMFNRAKTQNIKFHQFYEWIVHDIDLAKYGLDDRFEDI